MTREYLIPEGDLIDPSHLEVSKAVELMQLLISDAIPFTRFIECRTTARQETVVLEVEPDELSQKKLNDIRSVERVAILFDREDRLQPDVISLRADFPHVPHLNLRIEEYPKSFCLYEDAYTEQKRRWTALQFVEDIRTWLAKTARDELHQSGQPLEPLLQTTAQVLVVPSDLETSLTTVNIPKLVIKLVDPDTNVLLSHLYSGQTHNWSKGLFFAVTLQTDTMQHGIIHKRPATLRELYELTKTATFNLLNELRQRLADVISDRSLMLYPLILILYLPKQRTANGPIEMTDRYGFIIDKNVFQVGEDLGVWEKGPNGLPGLITFGDDSRMGDSIEIVGVLNIQNQLSRHVAAILNGNSGETSHKICSIGLGAIGSQVFLNLVRAGYGQWTLIDDDHFLPHNLARHALTGNSIALNKAESLAYIANSIIDGKDIADFLPVNIHSPKDKAEDLNTALAQADIILDMSASISVARTIAHLPEITARRISAFLNPSGTELIILAEDIQRQSPLDHLEMQYYVWLLEEPALSEHFKIADGKVRYAATCRDVTSRISQDSVASLSAIISRAIKQIANMTEASIQLWQINENTSEVIRFEKKPCAMYSISLGEWTLVITESLLNKMSGFRKQRLPNETGGILIGSYDLERKIIYAVDTVFSPKDSVERRSLYIRGCAELEQDVQQIQEKTLGMLEYIGEWHSHPDGVECKPSNDDKQVLSWLKSHLYPAGLPTIMAIACENDYCTWFVNEYMHSFEAKIPFTSQTETVGLSV